MVQAIIKIRNSTNQVLNIVKAKYGLKDKSEAIDKMAEEYNEFLMEPKLKPSYVKKASRIRKEKPVRVKSTAKLKDRLGVK